jgi:hypothetical protein
VDENVGTATVLRDEPEALFAVKPLHTALRHVLCVTFCSKPSDHFNSPCSPTSMPHPTAHQHLG